LVNEFKNIENLREASKAKTALNTKVSGKQGGSPNTSKEVFRERLEQIEGIGPVVAENIFSWFKEKENQKLIERLLKHLDIEKASIKSGGKLSGKSFVLTGTLSSMSRDEAGAKIKTLGGDVNSAVSKETNFVVAGENPGSKYTKAEELGVKILDENEFLELIS